MLAYYRILTVVTGEEASETRTMNLVNTVNLRNEAIHPKDSRVLSSPGASLWSKFSILHIAGRKYYGIP